MDSVHNPEGVTAGSVFFQAPVVDERLDSLVSDWVIRTIQIVVLVVLCGLISLGGLMANVINIIVFFRQGAMSDSSTLSLLALAFADIGCLAPVLCNSVSFAVMLVKPTGLYLHPIDFMEVSTIWVHIMFVQIASWITAYIAFERCLCVVFPFKVKQLFSAKRSLVVVSAISILYSLSFVPTFASLRLEEVENPFSNATELLFIVTDTYIEITMISDIIHAIIFRTLVLAIVFICTQITVYRVKLSKSWRKSIGASKNETVTNPSVAGDKQDEDRANNNYTPPRQTGVTGQSTCEPGKTKKTGSDATSLRERRLVRMITTISIIFMVCNLPDIVGVYLLHTVPSIQQLSHMDNLFVIMMAVQFCSESFNSAINLVVYYKMSTRYRHEFRAWLGLDTKSK